MSKDKIVILIVEDSITEQQMLKRIFVDEGYDVICASAGEEGIEKAMAEQPAVVLIDTVLPDIDGFEVCKRIHDVEGLNTKLIIHTGQIDAVDAIKARECGADEYSVKTEDYNELIEIVKQVLN